MRDYQEYDVRAADIYDTTPRWFRLVSCFINDRVNKRPFKGFYSRFLEFEIYIGEESLQRKKNKLYFKWDNE